ncbi:uncharacterized protein PG986_012184 [Apiospora aurea]|uniref:Uncharacterized protein n=1 Tax=Apiospora aurea TaxID=335848 RepID=A0ABR1Q0F2_9PEZI
METQRTTSLNFTLVGYVDDPDGRGTLSLLFSCLLTLGLCVWSAVHLNLPRHGETDLEFMYRNLKWSILGIFGPELVIWAAWRQLLSARSLTRRVKEGHRCTTSADQWSLVHGFYTGMGGFAFDTFSPDMKNGPSFIPKYQRLYITPRGIGLLADCGLLPYISRRDIQDRNKTDATGKVICCFQVGWMVVQVAARLGVGSPITPLETNTIGHVVCALISYALWWHKPKWIKAPTLVEGEWTREICAYMYMSSQVSSDDRVDRDFLRGFGVQTEMSKMVYMPPAAATTGTSQPGTLEPQYSNRHEEVTTKILRITEEHASRAFGLAGDTALSGGSIVQRSWYPGIERAQQKISGTKDQILKDMQMERWRLACDAIERHPALRRRLEYQETDQESRYREALRLYPEMPQKIRNHVKAGRTPNKAPGFDELKDMVSPSEELVVERPKNWPGDDLLRDMQGHLVGVVLWSASTLYGAVHLAGWNEVFPTPIEQWFWRASGAYLIFSGLLWSILNLLGHFSGSVWWYWYNQLAGHGSRMSRIILLILCTIGRTLYVVARVYLVVEALVSLRALPASAYDSPSWILTVPHV